MQARLREMPSICEFTYVITNLLTFGARGLSVPNLNSTPPRSYTLNFAVTGANNLNLLHKLLLFCELKQGAHCVDARHLAAVLSSRHKLC
jgi:hypothetical protein